MFLWMIQLVRISRTRPRIIAFRLGQELVADLELDA